MEKKQGRRAIRLSDHDIKLIVELITEMNVELRPTWAKVVELGKVATTEKFSRQALSAHNAIAIAYRDAVDRHWKNRGKRAANKPMLSADDLVGQKLARCEIKIREQAELIDALQDLLVRFVGNAQAAGISQEALETPLKARAELRSDVDAAAHRTREARRKQGGH